MTEESRPKINRCIAINDNGKMCRTRTQPGSYFCCDSHKPKNFDNLSEECNICCCNVEINEVIVLKCGHAQHRECFKMWMSSFKNHYCPLCLVPVLVKRQPKKKRKKNKIGNSPHMAIHPIHPIHADINIPIQYEPVTPEGSPPPLQQQIENISNLIVDKYSHHLIDYNAVHLGDVD